LLPPGATGPQFGLNLLENIVAGDQLGGAVANCAQSPLDLDLPGGAELTVAAVRETPDGVLRYVCMLNLDPTPSVPLDHFLDSPIQAV
jgi:hypothetical protein